MSKYFSCLLILTLFVSLSSYADVIFELDYKGSGQNKAGKSVFSIKGDNLRMDFYHNGKNPENSMIYRGDRNEIVTFDHFNKSYFVMDKQTMASMAGQMNQAMSQFEDAFKNMAPEQRAMMEKMMKGKMPAMNKASNKEPVLKRSGNVEVNGYACEKVDVYNDGEKIQQFCVTKWDNIKGGAEISRIMLEMSGFMEEWTKPFAQSSGFIGSSIKSQKSIFKQISKLGGFPVKTIDFANGSVVGESIFTSSKKTNVDPAVFEAPAGYKLQRMDMR